MRCTNRRIALALGAIGVGCFSIALSGCSAVPRLRAPDGRQTDLRAYECVSVTAIEVDRSIGFPNAPRQLASALDEALLKAERWVYQGSSGTEPTLASNPRDDQQSLPEPFRASRSVRGSYGKIPDECRFVQLSVTITKMPQRGLGEPRSMTCRVSVSDPETKTLLGEAEIIARSGQTMGHSMLTGAALGPAHMEPHMPDYLAKIFLYNGMAERIVMALDYAKSGS